MENIVRVLFLIVVAVLIAIGWRIFTKADKPGWASLIPVYNIYVLTQIVGRSGWWVLLALIPFLNIIAAFVLSVDLAKSFGKGTGFGLGLAVLGPIFGLMLAFGDAEYQGPSYVSGSIR